MSAMAVRDCGDARSYAHTYLVKLTQFVHCCQNLLAIRPFGIKAENRFDVVEDDEDLTRGKKLS